MSTPNIKVYTVRLFLLVYSLLFLIGCNDLHKEDSIEQYFRSHFNQKVEKLNWASLQELKSLHGKYVIAHGFFAYNFEDVALYHTRYLHFGKGIWLNLSPNISDSILLQYRYRSVSFIGKVDTLHHGHLGGYACILDSAFLYQGN